MFHIKLLVVSIFISVAIADSINARGKRAINFQANHNVKQLVENAENDFTVKTFTQSNRPTMTYTTETQGGVEILHSLRATLTKANMPATGSKRPGHPSGFAKRMTDLNKQQHDEVGHVLALSMGGPNELFNLVPQHSITNRNLHKTDDEYSYWNQTEGLIRDYLKDPKVKEIVWRVIMMYDGSLSVKKNRRPGGFGVIYTVHYHDRRTPPHDSSDLTFENDYN